MLGDGLGAVSADIGNGDTVAGGAGGVDIVGAGRREPDKAQLRSLFEKGVIEANFVDEYELGVTDAAGNLDVSTGGKDLQVREEVGQGREIETVAHRRVVEKHGCHCHLPRSLSQSN